MAKKSFFRTLVKLGGIAAATAVVYNKREEIRSFLNDAAELCFSQKTEPEEEYIVDEADVVIDVTQRAEETVEETPEE